MSALLGAVLLLALCGAWCQVWGQRLKVSPGSAGVEVGSLRTIFQDQTTNRYGFRDREGKEVVPAVYDEVHPDSFSVHLPLTGIVRFGKKWGLIDAEGRYLAKPVYDGLDFRRDQEFIHVRIDGLSETGVARHGFIDRRGREVIKPEWSQISWFEDNLANARSPVTGKWTLLGTDGKPALGQELDGPLQFSEGLAAVSVNKKFGVLNSRLEWVLQPQYDEIGDFKEGRARLRRNGHWGYLSRDGQIMIDPVFEGAQDFSEGRAGVQMVNRWGFIGLDGKLVAQPAYDSVRPFQNGMAMVIERGKIGYVNAEGKLVIEPEFTEASEFDAQGLAIAGSGDMHYMINREGARVARVIPKQQLIMVSRGKPLPERETAGAARQAADRSGNAEEADSDSPSEPYFVIRKPDPTASSATTQPKTAAQTKSSKRPSVPYPGSPSVETKPTTQSAAVSGASSTTKPMEKKVEHKSVLRIPPNLPIPGSPVLMPTSTPADSDEGQVRTVLVAPNFQPSRTKVDRAAEPAASSIASRPPVLPEPPMAPPVRPSQEHLQAP